MDVRQPAVVRHFIEGGVPRQGVDVVDSKQHRDAGDALQFLESVKADVGHIVAVLMLGAERNLRKLENGSGRTSAHCFQALLVAPIDRNAVLNMVAGVAERLTRGLGVLKPGLRLREKGGIGRGELLNEALRGERSVIHVGSFVEFEVAKAGEGGSIGEVHTHPAMLTKPGDGTREKNALAAQVTTFE